MRIQSSGALLLSALLPLASGYIFDCADVKTKEHTYDLSGLRGTHEIVHSSGNETAGQVTNTTYVLNICNNLKGAANRPEGKCGTTKNICGFIKTSTEDGGGSHWAYSLAGLEHLGEGGKDPEVTQLKEIDEAQEGVRIKMSGGEYKEEADAKKKPAAAVIDFQCDPDRSGLEGLANTEDVEKRRRDEVSKDPSLQFKSFGPNDDNVYILKLNWRTRYACDNYDGGNSGSGDSSKHWGFFTWLIIILFLAVAAYLIFGSWLNYNRHGARGWDLLPHGDNLRDIPYIFQDWVRRVLGTLQGGGTRGGYSAV
ncbi:autophagy protein Atg27 [Penicillium odoratum]|uniref:autophagy protein Atg27 n=1 Tax=Penicillium odoratum TaxID=1167516 RepID=UPI0025494F77|nr:autophagy protein Atg27 [Penicillium odoratum]KAJ5764909.1 autophagy protein Atg27 [Penicillium odoratum]